MNWKHALRVVCRPRRLILIAIVSVTLGLLSNTSVFNLNEFNSQRLEPYLDMFERLRGLHAVNSVEQALHRVVAGTEWQNPITVEGYTPRPNEPMVTQFKPVSRGYFTNTGTALISGRDFDERDTSYVDPKRPPRVCIINEAFAQKYFPDGSAVGRRVGMGNKPGTKPNIEIIGVVRNSPDKKPPEETLSEMFIPIDVSLLEPVA